MNGLDLFSGIGGIGIALSQSVRTVAYCERDRYAQGVLLSRMRSGDIDAAPIWDDVTTLRGEMLPRIDIISGGFPCQDISVAGRGAGLEGKRSGLFYEICRLTRELRPRFVFLENVPAITVRGLDQVGLAFAEMGYDCRWTTISAASVGANHKRERWFLLAYANGMRKLSEQGEHDWISDRSKNVADTMRKGLERHRKKSVRNAQEFGYACDNSWWATEPAVGRVADGVQNRAHRIRCLGNSVVPLQVREAFKKLGGLK